MPSYRAFFPALAQAQAAVARALASLNTSYKAAVAAAGATNVVAAPTTKTTVTSVTPLPAGASSSNVSAVNWRFSTPGGAIEDVTSFMPTSEAPISAPPTGIVSLVNSLTPKAVFTMNKPFRALVTAQDYAANLPSGTLFSHTLTGNVWKTTVGYTPVGIYSAVSLTLQTGYTQTADVNYGDAMRMLSAIAGIDRSAQVCNMADVTVPGGTALVNPSTGITYTTSADLSLTSPGSQLSGTTTGAVDFSSGTPATPLAVGATLNLVAPIAGVRSAATVSVSAALPVAAGLDMKNNATGRHYKTVGTTTLGDFQQGTIAFQANDGGGIADLQPGTVLTFQSPPTGLNASATVLSVNNGGGYPIDFPAQVIGDAPPWSGFVRNEPDGRWSANVFTVPLGS